MVKLIDYEALYLSYFNDFLTVERFAEYYGMSVEVAEFIIAKGREINNRSSNASK